MQIKNHFLKDHDFSFVEVIYNILKRKKIIIINSTKVVIDKN